MSRLLKAAACAVVLATLCTVAQARNPGISVRFSQAFFNYTFFHQIAPLIKEKIAGVKLPPVTYHIPYINTDLFLTDLAFTLPSYRLGPATILTPDSSKNSLELFITLYIQGGGRWSTRARWWPYITSDGSVRFWVNPLRLAVDIDMVPGPDGIWQFGITRLEESANLKIKFYGGVMGAFDIGALENYINQKASQAISSLIHNTLAKVLKKVTPMMKKYLPYVTVPQCVKMGLPPACKDFGINLSLVSSGVWATKCRAEIQLNGYMVYKNVSYLPTSAKAFPTPHGCGDHDVAVFLSGSTFSSAIKAVLQSRLLHANFRSGKKSDFPLYNRFIPGLKKKFGSQPLYFNMTLLDSSIILRPGVAVTTISVAFQVLVDTTPKRRTAKIFEEAFTMRVNVTVSLAAWIKATRTPIGILNMLYLNFTNAQVSSVTLIHTDVGPFNATQVKSMMQILLSTAFRNADRLVSEGMLVLPKQIKGVYLKNPEFIFQQDYLKLAIDVSSVPSASEEATGDWVFEDGAEERTMPLLESIDLDHVPTALDDALNSAMEAFITAYQTLGRTLKSTFFSRHVHKALEMHVI